jgi:uncharacterized protein HemX
MESAAVQFNNLCRRENMTREEARPLLKLGSVWAALIMLAVAGLVWGGEQKQRNAEFDNHIQEAKVAMQRFEELNAESKVTKAHYEEILRRLERMEAKMDSKGGGFKF